MGLFDELKSASFGGAPSPSQVKETMDNYASSFFEQLGIPNDAWRKRVGNAQIGIGEKLIDGGAIREDGTSWYCTYVVTLDGKELPVHMKITRCSQVGVPQGSVEFADVWLKPDDDIPAFLKKAKESLLAKARKLR